MILRISGSSKVLGGNAPDTLRRDYTHWWAAYTGSRTLCQSCLRRRVAGHLVTYKSQAPSSNDRKTVMGVDIWLSSVPQFDSLRAVYVSEHAT